MKLDLPRVVSHFSTRRLNDAPVKLCGHVFQIFAPWKPPADSDFEGCTFMGTARFCEFLENCDYDSSIWRGFFSEATFSSISDSVFDGHFARSSFQKIANSKISGYFDSASFTDISNSEISGDHVHLYGDIRDCVIHGKSVTISGVISNTKIYVENSLTVDGAKFSDVELYGHGGTELKASRVSSQTETFIDGFSISQLVEISPRKVIFRNCNIGPEAQIFADQVFQSCGVSHTAISSKISPPEVKFPELGEVYSSETLYRHAKKMFMVLNAGSLVKTTESGLWSISGEQRVLEIRTSFKSDDFCMQLFGYRAGPVAKIPEVSVNPKMDKEKITRLLGEFFQMAQRFLLTHPDVK